MSEKIIIKEGKTLKLQNVLIREVSQEEILNSTRTLHMMNSYILSKNVNVTGPLINYSNVKMDGERQPVVTAKFMLQLSSDVVADFPYIFEKTVVEKDCLFARFHEKEENLQFAYQKLGVYAFENDIKLRGDSYTVFVKRDPTDYIMADIFMPVKNF